MKKEVGTHHIITLGIATIVLLSAVSFMFFSAREHPTPLTGYATSQVGNFSASVATYLACTWSNSALSVGFGSNLNPGDVDINATGNYNATYSGNWTMYNVTIDSISNVVANITIKGENFVAGSSVIGITNISWASNTTSGNGTNLAPGSAIVLNSSFNDQDKVASGEAVGSTVWFRFWFDVPNGTTAGSYTGNYTQQCSQGV